MDGTYLDFRSDTVTRPTDEMRQAMATAKVGDDVYGEDPTVNELEQYAAELLGKPASLFLPTCTMANLIAVLTHCNGRFSEFIVGDKQHLHVYEVGGSAALGGVHTRTVPNNPDGTFDINKFKELIRVKNVHFPVTRLVAVENTNNLAGGRVLPIPFLEQISAISKERGLKFHMDGARLFNAVVASNTSAANICKHVDSVSICLSKGLASPAGALLAGDKEFISLARHARKALGGGMRQAGVLAACGLISLRTMTKRLHEDHSHAKKLATGLASMDKYFEVPCGVENVETNMFYFKLKSEKSDANSKFVSELRSKYNINLDASQYSGGTMRLVTHVDVPISNADYVLQSFEAAARAVV